MRALAAPPTSTLRPKPLFAGVVLLLIYVRIGTVLGFHASYGPTVAYERGARSAFTYIGNAEMRLWLAQLVLALPAALLIAWGLAPRLAPLLRRLVARVDGAPARWWWWAAGILFVTLFAVYAFGHAVILCGRPITDDESAVTFGARMLAGGHLRMPLLPAHAFTDIFTYQRDGMVSAMDFPGLLRFGAAGIATGLGHLVYALASAASGVAVGYAAKRWLGPRGCVLATAIWIASPMILSLSVTSHGQVPSRMFVALALLFASRLDTAAGSPRCDAVMFGLVVGLGFLCRPPEIAFLLGPLGGWLVYRAPRRVPLIALGLVGPLVLFAWYNAQITGLWYLPSRFAEGIIGAGGVEGYSIPDRVGANLGFNLLVLAVFFLGIPAIAAIAGALDRTRPILLVLAACVLGQFALCLAHDNTGIHMVGPIHLSESTVPLTILAAAGILRGFAWLAARGLSQRSAAILVGGYLVIACGLFDVSNLASLHDTTAAQGVPEERITALNIHHAIVLAPPYSAWAFQNEPTGTWILAYPHPDPFYRDDLIFAAINADRAMLRKLFPDRPLFEVTYARHEPTIIVGPAP